MALPNSYKDREYQKFRDISGNVSVSVTSDQLISKISKTGSTSYIGEALPGSIDSDAKWRITRITETGNNTDILVADSGEFTQVWNDRESLIYG